MGSLSRWNDDRLDDLAMNVQVLRTIPESVAVMAVTVENLASTVSKLSETVEKLDERIDYREEAKGREQHQDRRALWALTGSIFVAIVGALAIFLTQGPT